MHPRTKPSLSPGCWYYQTLYYIVSRPTSPRSRPSSHFPMPLKKSVELFYFYQTLYLDLAQIYVGLDLDQIFRYVDIFVIYRNKNIPQSLTRPQILNLELGLGLLNMMGSCFQNLEKWAFSFSFSLTVRSNIKLELDLETLDIYLDLDLTSTYHNRRKHPQAYNQRYRKASG